MQVSKLVRAIRYSILILFFSSVPVVISLAGGQKESAPSQQASSAKSADAQLSAAAASQLLVKGKLVVGLMGTYPPYNFLNSSHEVDGFDADIAKEVARRIGLDAQFIPTEWSGMIEGLLKGKFDVVISQMTITDDRKKVMDFSQPYMKNPVNVIVRSDNATITGLADLKGKRVGVGLGTNDEAYLRNVAIPQVGQFTIATYDDVITSLKDLSDGRIDATINNIYAIAPVVQQNHYQIKAVGDPIKVDYAAVALQKNHAELLAAIDKALTDMKSDGTYTTIFRKWFNADPTP